MSKIKQFTALQKRIEVERFIIDSATELEIKAMLLQVLNNAQYNYNFNLSDELFEDFIKNKLITKNKNK